jgi:hypothetical protein
MGMHPRARLRAVLLPHRTGCIVVLFSPLEFRKAQAPLAIEAATAIRRSKAPADFYSNFPRPKNSLNLYGREHQDVDHAY